MPLVFLRVAPDDELSDFHGLGLPHDYYQRCHEQRLEGLVCQLIPFKELHGQQTKRVHCINRHLQVLVAADLHKEIGEYSPDAVPNQPAHNHIHLIPSGSAGGSAGGKKRRPEEGLYCEQHTDKSVEVQTRA